jgi:hypothetical protein
MPSVKASAPSPWRSTSRMKAPEHGCEATAAPTRLPSKTGERGPVSGWTAEASDVWRCGRDPFSVVKLATLAGGERGLGMLPSFESIQERLDRARVVRSGRACGCSAPRIGPVSRRVGKPRQGAAGFISAPRGAYHIATVVTLIRDLPASPISVLRGASGAWVV